MLTGRIALVTTVAALLVALPTPSQGAVPRCAGERATIVGTDRPERLVGTSGRDVVVAKRGDDVILARGGDDVICGGRGEDVLEGGPGDDHLVGGPDGNTDRPDFCLEGDHLDGGSGADLVDPGVDPRRATDDCGTFDQVRFRHGHGAVRVDLAAGTATGQGSDRIVVGGQGLEVVGSDGDDELLGSDLDEEFDARLGDDTVTAGGGRDEVIEGLGANGDDTYDLGAGDDVLAGRRGSDEVTAGPGDDDVLLWNPEAVRVDAGDGDDRTVRYASPGGDQLAGGDGSDRLTLDLADVAADASVLDIPAARWTVGEQVLEVTGTEEWEFAAAVPLTVWGSEGRDVVSAPGKGSEEAPLTAHLRGGPDVASAYRSDDYVDGGEGDDQAYLGPGTNTCVDVESGPC